MFIKVQHVQDLSLFPGYKMRSNEVALDVKLSRGKSTCRNTFTLCEYAMVSGTPVEEAVKKVSKRAEAHYTHSYSYYKLPISHTVALASHQNFKANLKEDNQKRES